MIIVLNYGNTRLTLNTRHVQAVMVEGSAEKGTVFIAGETFDVPVKEIYYLVEAMASEDGYSPAINSILSGEDADQD